MAPRGGRRAAGYAVAVVVAWCAFVHQVRCAAAGWIWPPPTPSAVPTYAPIPIPADGTVWVPTEVASQNDIGGCDSNAIAASANGDVFCNELGDYRTLLLRGNTSTSFSSYPAGGMVMVPAEGTLVYSVTVNNVIYSFDLDLGSYKSGPVAGAGSGTSDGIGTIARFTGLMGVTLAPPSTLYVADCDAHTIRKLVPAYYDGNGKTTAYNVTTPAGTGDAAYTDGPGSVAKFNSPVSVAAAGIYLYIVDRYNYVIRRMDMNTNVVSTIVGTGQNGYSGDGGPATLATLAAPISVAVDNDGTLLFIADADHVRIVNLATNNTSTGNIAGGWRYGTIWSVSAPLSDILYISTSCSVFRAVPLPPTPSPSVAPSPLPTVAYIPTPVSSCAPAAVAAGTYNITYDSAIIAGGGVDTSDGATALEYAFASPPLALATTPNYDAWVGSVGSLDVVRGGTVFWATPQSVVERITAVAVTPGGDVWMYDDGLDAFRVMRAATGNIVTTTYATGNMSGMTYANMWNESSLLIADSANHVVWQLRMSSYSLEPMIGVYGERGSVSGPLTATTLSAPADVAWFPPTGRMYVADSGNYGVRRVNMADSNSSPVPQLNSCAYSSVAVDGMGALWVACPMSPALLRVIDDGTSTPSVVSVIPRSGMLWNGNHPYIVVVHPLTHVTFNVTGHRVVRAGATDIIHTIPILPPGTPPVVTAFIATNTACMPAPPATPTATPSVTLGPADSASGAGGVQGGGEEEQYPLWVLVLVGAALVVGGFGTVIGGAALVQRCLNAGGGISGRKRAKDLGAAAAAAKGVHVNPLVAAAAPYRSGGGRPFGASLPSPGAAASNRGQARPLRAALPPVTAPGTRR